MSNFSENSGKFLSLYPLFFSSHQHLPESNNFAQASLLKGAYPWVDVKQQ